MTERSATDYIPWGTKRWRIWNFDATRSGVSGPETLPPANGVPQPGLKATEDAPIEVMAVAEHEAIIRHAEEQIEDHDRIVSSLQRKHRTAYQAFVRVVESHVKWREQAEQRADSLEAERDKHQRCFEVERERRERAENQGQANFESMRAAADREQDRAEVLKATLEKIATGRAPGATPFDHWALCKQFAAEALEADRQFVGAPQPNQNTGSEVNCDGK